MYIGENLMYEIWDYHAHNGYYRGSGEIWPPEVGLKRANIQGLAGLGIANKVEFNHPNHSWIPVARKTIDCVGTAKLLLGIELDIGHPSGKTVLDGNYLQYLDYIIAGPHNQPVQTLTWEDLEDEDLQEYFDSYRNILLHSLENPKNPIDIWAHPFLQEIEYTGAKYEQWLLPIFENVLEVCAQMNIALEINENFFRKQFPPKMSTLWWKNNAMYFQEKYLFLRRLFKKALRETNLEFCFASDSHDLDQAGNVKNCVKFAKEIGIPEKRLKKIIPKHTSN